MKTNEREPFGGVGELAGVGGCACSFFCRNLHRNSNMRGISATGWGGGGVASQGLSLCIESHKDHRVLDFFFFFRFDFQEKMVRSDH